MRRKAASDYCAAAPRAEHAHNKAKEHASEDKDASGSEDEFSDSDDEGVDGYKRGVFVCSLLLAACMPAERHESCVLSCLD